VAVEVVKELATATTHVDVHQLDLAATATVEFEDALEELRSTTIG
jgi:hypothetical protein